MPFSYNSVEVEGTVAFILSEASSTVSGSENVLDVCWISGYMSKTRLKLTRDVANVSFCVGGLDPPHLSSLLGFLAE